MYASLPSADATTSCGSGPVGAVPRMFNVAASMIASVLSPLLMTRSKSAATTGVATSAKAAPVSRSRVMRAIVASLARSGHTCVMPPVFRRAVALVVLALATPGAQQREAGTESQQPTFRAGVNVVRVDVSVTGRNDEAIE